MNLDFATPVSDGKHIYVSLGQGQVACYDLNGARRWAVHVPLKPESKARRVDRRLAHCVSPLLVGDLLIVQQVQQLLGIDKKTGATVWENPDVFVAGYNMGSYKHLRLRNGDRSRDVICTTRGQIVDAATGKTLAVLLEDKECARWDVAPPVIGSSEGVICWRDQSASANVISSLSLTADARLETTKRTALEIASTFGGHALILDQDRLFATNEALCSLSTGKVTTRLRDVAFGGVGPILAGKVVLGAGRGWGVDGELRSRPDRVLVMDYPVVDLTDPAKPRIVKGQNLLGGIEKPHVRCLEKWAPAIYEPDPKHPEDTVWGLMGVPLSWSAASPAAQGNRLFLRTMSYLYCIGDPKVPYDWNPASRGGQAR